MRAFSSAVAARVKVITRRWLIGIPASTMKRSTRCLIEKVFPVPADASSSVGTSKGADATSNPGFFSFFSVVIFIFPRSQCTSMSASNSCTSSSLSTLA